MRRLPLLLLPLVLTACTSSDGPQAAPGPCGAATVQPPADALEQTEQADLDGDGEADRVVSYVAQGQRVAQVQLADGRAADPEPLFAGDLLAAADADGDGKAEVFASTSRVVQGAATTLTGTAFVLDGCRLVPVTGPAGPLEYTWSVGVDAKDAAATLVCRPGGVLEQVVSRPGRAPGTRNLQTRRWTLQGGAVGEPVAAGSTVPAAQDPALATDSSVACA